MPRWPLDCPDVTYAIISREVEKIAHVSRRRVFPVSSRVIQEVRLLLDSEALTIDTFSPFWEHSARLAGCVFVCLEGITTFRRLLLCEYEDIIV
jgi:hypothetical protein